MARPVTSPAGRAGPLWALFGFDGRLSRQPYWLGFLFVFLIVTAATAPLAAPTEEDGILVSPITLVVFVAAIWSQFALAVKRLHDRDLTGWFCLVLFAPLLVMATPLFIPLATVINFGFFGAIGLVPGTPGPNRYGSGPNQRGR